MRRRLTEALENAGIAQQIAASRVFVRPPVPGGPTAVGPDGPVDHGVAGAT